jgi:jumonji domain-containing protein 7
VDTRSFLDKENAHVSPEDPDFAWKMLSLESRELYWNDIPRISFPISPLEFYREFVSQNRPCIITGAIKSQWPAIRLWNNDYLRQKAGNVEVTVDVTPDGFGDHVVDDKYFVKPLQEKMKFGDFIDVIEKKKPSSGVYYIQHQNSNFTTEFQVLWKDVPDNMEIWGTRVFGVPPDAVNIWMGTRRSVSSLHKDHYENLYCVVRGQKHFTLLPPCDYYFLYEQEYISATYSRKKNSESPSECLRPKEQNHGRSYSQNCNNDHNHSTSKYEGNDGHYENDFCIVEDVPPSKVPWIPVDPDTPNYVKFPKSKWLRPLRCTVNEGEVLYLPSLNFHRVSQSGDNEGKVIAINYWFDMQFDIRYTYFKFMENLIKTNTASSNKGTQSNKDEKKM